MYADFSFAVRSNVDFQRTGILSEDQELAAAFGVILAPAFSLVFFPTHLGQLFAVEVRGRRNRGPALITDVAKRFDASVFGLKQARQLPHIHVALVLNLDIHPSGLIALAEKKFQLESCLGKLEDGHRVIFMGPRLFCPT